MVSVKLFCGGASGSFLIPSNRNSRVPEEQSYRQSPNRSTAVVTAWTKEDSVKK